jgi:hypothetical protein
LETTADVAGFIPDVSQGITNAIVGGNAENPLGSKSFSRNLQALGLGYYDSSKGGPDFFQIKDGEEPATIGDMPPSTRPYAVAGEEMSTAAATTMGIGALARGRTAMQLANPVRDQMVPMTLKNPLAPIENTAGFIRNSTKDIIDFAAKNPAQFRKMETSVAILSGIGGGIAETVAPGDPTARMIGSIAAPLSPTTLPIAAQGSYALLNKVTYGSVDKLSNAIAMKFRGREGALDAVGRKFQDAVVAQGVKPEDLVNQIDNFIKNNPQYANQKGNLSAGLATGDDTLLAIERSLIAGDSEISKKPLRKLPPLSRR